MKNRGRWLLGAALAAAWGGAGGWLPGNALALEPPRNPPGPLSEIPVPAPDLRGVVVNMNALKILGKALFWDLQAGSDGQACASCHFHAGADSRTKNQLSPGLLRVEQDRTPDPDFTFGDAGLTRSGAIAGPNYELIPGDFPFHQLADPEDRNSAVLFSMNDAASSQGTFDGPFVTVIPGARENPLLGRPGVPTGAVDRVREALTRATLAVVPRDTKEICGPLENTGLTELFSVNGVPVRRVEPRNTPTTISAVFNHRNFWDGRANNLFNGVDPLGLRNPDARIILYEGGAARLQDFIAERPEAAKNSSLASQAVGPPLNDLEMSCSGRTFADVGRKLLSLRPLAQQKVHRNDSLLAPLRHHSGQGLTSTYARLIISAFHPDYWRAPGRFRLEAGPTLVKDPNGYTQMELNFSFYWGIAIQAYEATLVYARHGRDLMGCKSPVCEPCFCFDYRNINTSRRQGRPREGSSEGSRSATL